MSLGGSHPHDVSDVLGRDVFWDFCWWDMGTGVGDIWGICVERDTVRVSGTALWYFRMGIS